MNEKLVLDYNWDIDSNKKQQPNSDNIIYKGYDALYSNILACISIGDIMKSLLGPKSRDKLIVDQFDQVLISNDGKIEHPASKMMVELSMSMDEQNGDGTTSVIVLCTYLLRKSLRLLKGNGFNTKLNGIHPIQIVNGFLRTSKIVLDTIHNLSNRFIVDSEQGRDILLKVCQTTLNSKLVSHTCPILSNFSVELMMILFKSLKNQDNNNNNNNNNNDSQDDNINISTNNINIIDFDGGFIENSRVSKSFIIKSEFVNQFYQSTSPYKVVFLKLPQLIRPKEMQTISYQLNSNFNIETILLQEENKIKSLVVKLKKNGINLIAIEDDLSSFGNLLNLFVTFLNKAKISLLKPLSSTEFKRISKLLRIPIIVDINQLTLKPQTFQSISTEVLDNQHSIVLFQDVSITSPSIILYGSTTVELEESKRALHDSLCVLRNLIRSPIIVPGGGACEIEASIKIQEYLNTQKGISTVESNIMLAYSESLEEYVGTLCTNSGLDHLDIIHKLKQHHKSPLPDSYFYGIDLNTEKIQNMTQIGIIEPLSNKLSQISLSTEILISILKIDEIIFYK
ncbi:Coatamer protein [Tieghemostelium lacteum]|uniref:Coatamer protein n=1 Tax=Tieghemostelium lacteum TaxID=361077 RepID=A0A152A0Y7_TIELA|nr:Coatamer protein [Tieghemostelium lacteum]|eukprot:KYQ99922.1 Coatamer protein [Tieghemostelium lacteum]